MQSLRFAAKAQIFPLSEKNLPPGTYVVTPEGYWPIEAWIAAHPGKSIPASIITVPEQPAAPQVTVKTGEHGHGNEHHRHFTTFHCGLVECIDIRQHGTPHDGHGGGPGKGDGGSSGGGSSGGGSSSGGGGSSSGGE